MRQLPPGWYPASGDQVAARLRQWEQDVRQGHADFRAVVVPHAGWDFSGSLAYATLSRLAQPIHTVVVAGGHLRQRDSITVAAESGFQTPVGTIRADECLRRKIIDQFDTREEVSVDNTVEVQLPLVASIAPTATVVWLRCPPDERSYDLGRFIADVADEPTVVVGSTDLTHYGPAYGYAPAGGGAAGQEWADQNDREMTEYLIEMDARGAAQHAVERRAACSIGGALCAMGFAASRGASSGVLVGRGSSLSMHASESFVGYAGIGYPVERTVD